jgi:hypothetical protein
VTTFICAGGTYCEKVALTRSGTPEAPITIASYPGEMAIIDGGLREFYESPATSWEPYTGGAPGEYVSTKSYLQVDDRKVPRQFLPASWEPMWGKEGERPLALGNFGDSLVPLHGYRFIEDLRSKSEFWVGGGKKEWTDTHCGRPVVRPRVRPGAHPACAPTTRRPRCSLPTAARPTRASSRSSSPWVSVTTFSASTASPRAPPRPDSVRSDRQPR